MIGQRTFTNPTVHVPPWPILDDPTITNIEDYAVPALHQLISSYEADVDPEVFCSDHFRMFEFKVRKCARARSHDWTECPFVHPGEKARRRDPRKFHYSGTPCPEFRKGNCKKGDLCEHGHGVFECWLHPSRYRTQPCKDGLECPRRVCFFAHSLDQLRVLTPTTPDTSDICRSFPFLPDSTSSPPLSPPLLPLSAMTRSLRQLQLSKVKSMPCSWGAQSQMSPRFAVARPGFYSLPTTPTGMPACVGIGTSDEEVIMERVESGRDLRAKMFEKLSRENFLDEVDLDSQHTGPDIGWVSDLLK